MERDSVMLESLDTGLWLLALDVMLLLALASQLKGRDSARTAARLS